MCSSHPKTQFSPMCSAMGQRPLLPLQPPLELHCISIKLEGFTLVFPCSFFASRPWGDALHPKSWRQSHMAVQPHILLLPIDAAQPLSAPHWPHFGDSAHRTAGPEPGALPPVFWGAQRGSAGLSLWGSGWALTFGSHPPFSLRGTRGSFCTAAGAAFRWPQSTPRHHQKETVALMDATDGGPRFPEEGVACEQG